MEKFLDVNEWKEFSVKELGFVCHHGQRLNQSERKDGPIPFVTAGFQNHGVTQYISNDRPTYHKAITVDMFGNCFFQTDDCAGDDNVYFFVNDKLTDCSKLFVSACIAEVTSKKFSYTKQFRQHDANVLKVFLPVTPSSDPDWAYMDSFMGKILEEEEVAAEQLAALAPETGSDGHFLDVSGWKAFQIGNLLGTAKHGNWIDPKSLDENESGYRIVSASTINNGASIERYSIPDEKYIVPAKVITWGKQSPFFAYQKEPTISGQGIYYYDVSQRTSQQALFLCGVMQSRIADKYNYQDCLIGCKCDEETIYLPSTPSGDPDWGWMEQYMQQQLDKTEKLAKHLNELN